MKAVALFIIISFSLPGNLKAEDGKVIFERIVGSDKTLFGVSVSAAGGVSNFTIDTSGGEAIYSGYGLGLQINIPVWKNKISALNVGLNVEYIDAANNANSDLSKEMVKFMGPGGGINFNIYRVLIGVNYSALKAQHYWLGNPHEELSYDLNLLSYYYGIHFSINDSLSVLLSQNISKGSLPSEKTNFSRDAPFNSSTFWIHFSYNSGKSIPDFMESLFK
ncbi:hypothetical protein OAQ84_00700 [Bdellovibrionales bacterium]|nr:hypothetical protein [Bdellovibrionales bacterium]